MRERIQHAARRRSSALEGHLRAAKAIVLGIVVCVGGWSLTAQLSGAVIAPGRVAVDGKIKRVQASAAGPVAEILVKEGDRVEAGAVLLRLDDTQPRSALNIVTDEIVKLEAQMRRLRAERDGATALERAGGTANPAAALAQHEEQRLFQLRLDVHTSQVRRLDERKSQPRRELDAISSQMGAKARELAVIESEKRLVDDLYRRGLTTRVRVVALERDKTRFEGEHGALLAQSARVSAQLGEVDQQIAALEQTRLSEAQQELRTAERKLEEAEERRISARDQLQRMQLRAPVGGIVHDLTIPGPGAVLQPGEIAMSIVPERDQLVAEVRIRPQDIDQVQPGQRTRVKFTAFNQRTTPEVDGDIARVAADLKTDERTGEPYYVAAVNVRRDSLARLGDMKLVPGMPAEAYILTGERTLASYLLRPLTDQMGRALRED